MNYTYTPTPLDVSSVQLSPELQALTEKLAEHIHDIWATERIEQGWRHGSQRNDNEKEHPCLVPYDQLSDYEKKFDRATALGSLKAIAALGYIIELS